MNVWGFFKDSSLGDALSRYRQELDQLWVGSGE